MSSIVMEFLITFDGKGEFCKNVAGFNSLLESIDELKCLGDSIQYKELELCYANTLLEGDSSRNRIFHAVFELFDAEEDHVLLFERLC